MIEREKIRKEKILKKYKKITRIEKIVDSMNAEEKLIYYEFFKDFREPIDETIHLIFELLEKYKTIEKVAEILGVDSEWLEYYIEHHNKNPPATP